MTNKLEYPFAAIAKELGASLIRGAEDNVSEAQALMENVKKLVAEIQIRVEEHTKVLDGASARTKAYGERVLAAHREYISGGIEPAPAVMEGNPAANVWPAGIVIRETGA